MGSFRDFDLSFYLWEEILSISKKLGVTEYTFRAVFPGFMKPIHIELSNEAIDSLMPKIFWEDNFFKLVDILDDEVPTTL